jgi:hypothetical protein
MAAARRENVGSTERAASAALGAALAVGGLLRGRTTGALMAAAGGMLLHRGATGYCALNQLIGRDSAEPAARRPGAEAAGIEEPWHPRRGADRWSGRVTGGEAGAMLGQTRGPAARGLDEQVEETFPASDPPAFAGGAAVPGGAPGRPSSGPAVT